MKCKNRMIFMIIENFFPVAYSANGPFTYDII